MLERLLLVSLPQTHKRPATARLCRACWSATSSKVGRADGQFVLVVWQSNEAIGPTRLVAMIRSAYRTVRLTTAYKTTKGTAKAVPFLFLSPVQYIGKDCRLPLSLRGRRPHPRVASLAPSGQFTFWQSPGTRCDIQRPTRRLPRRRSAPRNDSLFRCLVTSFGRAAFVAARPIFHL